MIPDVGGNDRLAGRTFFRVVPRLLLNNAVPYGLGNQLSDFLAVQGNEFVVGVQLVELGTKIKRVNAWIKPLQHQEMLLAQERIVPFDDLAFQRGGGDTQPLRRWTNDRPGLQQNDPVVRGDIVWMDWNKVTRHFSAKYTHFVRNAPL